MAKGGSKSGSKTLTGILCFIFGFLFAIIVEVALIAGGVYFLMKADIDDVLSLVGVENEDENGNKIIINTNVDDGGVQNITDLITAVRDMFGNGVDNLTIGEVEGLFPVADRFVDSIYSGLAGALSAYDLTEEDLREIIDEEELKATPFSQMGEFITECLNNVGDAIDEVVLADVLTVDTGADSFELMAYMVYGINNITPVQSPAYIEIDGVQVEYRYTATYHYLYEEGGDIKTQECDAYVAVDSEGVISAVYYALAEGGYGECGTRLDDVSTRIDGLMNDLTIGELIEIDEDNTILNAISGATISTLDETINALSIQELFTKDIYGVETPYEVIESGTAGAGEIAFDSSYLYYYYNSENELVFVNSESGSGSGSLGHLEEFTDEYGTLYTYGPTAGAWSLLLYGDYDETAEGSDIGEKVYTINNVAQMQANVIENIGSCSLNEFEDMGVIEYSQTLDVPLSTIFPEYTASEGKTTVGDLTMSEFLDALGTLVDATQGATETP